MASWTALHKILHFLVHLLVFSLFFYVVFYHILEPLCQNTYLSVTCSTRYLGLWMSLFGFSLWIKAELGRLAHSKLLLLFGLVNIFAFLGFYTQDLNSPHPSWWVFVWLIFYVSFAIFFAIRALKN